MYSIIENGKIYFNGSISRPAMKMLFIEKKKVLGVLVEPGDIVADSKLQYFTGTPLNDAFTEFMKGKSWLRTDSIDSFVIELKAFVRSHNNDLAGMKALGTYQEVLSLEDKLELVSSCGETIKENPLIKRNIELWENEYITRPGQKFVDLELTSSGNKKKTI